MPEHREQEYVERVRTVDEVAHRCIVLCAVIAGGHGEPRQELVVWLHREGVWNVASPEEVAILQTDAPMQQQLINATWRAEALLPLLWSLGRVSEMQPPTALCDVQALRRALPPLLGSVAEFVSTSRLLPSSAIHDANDEIYHIHWKVRDTQLNNKPIPDSYVPGVAKERHYALNWLICYFDQDWDDISTDT